ncbi:hypothetical protein [Leifsonia shinshuensis]
MPTGYLWLGVAFAAASVIAIVVWVVVERRRGTRAASARARSAAWSAGTTSNLAELHGAALSRVTFDGSDPQLEFEKDLRLVVTLTRWPALVVGNRVLRFGHAEYRVRLAELLGDRVRSARTSIDHEVVLELSRGSLLIEP